MPVIAGRQVVKRAVDVLFDKATFQDVIRKEGRKEVGSAVAMPDG